MKAMNFHNALVSALSELTATIEAYELNEELDAGCDGKGPYETAVKLLKKIEKHNRKDTPC